MVIDIIAVYSICGYFNGTSIFKISLWNWVKIVVVE